MILEFLQEISLKRVAMKAERIKYEIKDVKFAIYFVVGNHDVGIGYDDNKRKIYQENFGEMENFYIRMIYL